VGGSRGSFSACALAFVTAAVTLFLQVLVHRIVSAKLLNNYAFLVISLTMLGFALSGVLLSRWLPQFLEHFEWALAMSGALFVLSVLASVGAFYRVRIELADASRLDFARTFLYAMPFALLLAAPFVFCGLILGGLLSAPGLPARLVYCFDLLGSATGAFAVIPAIRHLGVENSLLVACGMLLAATLVLAPPRQAAARLIVLAAALSVVFGALFRERLFDMTYSRFSVLGAARDAPAALRRRVHAMGSDRAHRALTHPPRSSRRPRSTPR
jgi:hypothetical protein